MGYIYYQKNDSVNLRYFSLSTNNTIFFLSFGVLFLFVFLSAMKVKLVIKPEFTSPFIFCSCSPDMLREKERKRTITEEIFRNSMIDEVFLHKRVEDFEEVELGTLKRK